MNILPPELILEIFEFLEVADIVNVAITSKYWNQFITIHQRSIFRKTYQLVYGSREYRLQIDYDSNFLDITQQICNLTFLIPERQFLTFQGSPLLTFIPKWGFPNPLNDQITLRANIRRALNSSSDDDYDSKKPNRYPLELGEYPPEEVCQQLALRNPFVPNRTQLILTDINELVVAKELFGASQARVYLGEKDTVDEFLDRLALTFQQQKINAFLGNQGNITSLDYLRRARFKKVFIYRSVGLEGKMSRITAEVFPDFNAKVVDLMTPVKLTFVWEKPGAFGDTKWNVTLIEKESGELVPGKITEINYAFFQITFMPDRQLKSSKHYYAKASLLEDPSNLSSHIWCPYLPSEQENSLKNAENKHQKYLKIIAEICSEVYAKAGTISWHFYT